jgi:predicted DNA-binding transcriptional regulator AlpA
MAPKANAPARPVDEQLARAIVEGKVELLGVDEIVSRLGVSRSTLERWIRNTRASLTGGGDVAGALASFVEGKTGFPPPDVYIGASPRWIKETVVKWVMTNSTKR